MTAFLLFSQANITKETVPCDMLAIPTAFVTKEPTKCAPVIITPRLMSMRSHLAAMLALNTGSESQPTYIYLVRGLPGGHFHISHTGNVLRILYILCCMARVPWYFHFCPLSVQVDVFQQSRLQEDSDRCCTFFHMDYG